jgi:sterol carrier protein 2
MPVVVLDVFHGFLRRKPMQNVSGQLLTEREVAMGRRVNVIGVGMTKFAKPGASPEYNEMAAEAARTALKDAGVDYKEIEQAYTGYVYGDSTCGQRSVYDVGLTGIPVFNVNNNCSTGSTALFLARQAIEGGLAECVLALGFEKMEKGALSSKYDDRLNPMDRHVQVMNDVQGFTAAPAAAQMFGGAGREYQWKYGAKRETFGKISEKARKHAANNPYAIFNQLLSLEEIMAAPEVFDPLTRYQCCPPTCGAAAAVLCSDDFIKKHGISNPVYIAAQTMTTDYSSSFGEDSMIKMVGYDMAKQAAKQAYEKAGIGPEDVDVVELHDCFTANELLSYEALGLCPEGGAEQFIWDGNNTYGGKYVVNPSGGLLSKGHPLGATGLAQCTELVWQLRGTSDKRQVEGAKVALQHNLGLGGACVITVYRANLSANDRKSPPPYAKSSGVRAFSFNHTIPLAKGSINNLPGAPWRGGLLWQRLQLPLAISNPLLGISAVLPLIESCTLVKGSTSSSSL